tara:strand:+ start:20881 stop:21438 length:558 start_codon:yes stop_codon:yes gene_type:complete
MTATKRNQAIREAVADIISEGGCSLPDGYSAEVAREIDAEMAQWLSDCTRTQKGYWREREPEEFLKVVPKSTLVLLKHSGAKVGFMILRSRSVRVGPDGSKNIGCPKDLYFQLLFVGPDHRRRGLARAMFALASSAGDRLGFILRALPADRYPVALSLCKSMGLEVERKGNRYTSVQRMPRSPAG